MEPADKKQHASYNEHGSGEQAHRTRKEKAPGNTKSWWEQLAGTIPEDKEEVKNWYKLLSNPLLLILGIMLLAWWMFTKKLPAGNKQEQENQQLKQEIKQLRKKYKKLKKHMRNHLANEGDMRRSVVMD